MSIFGTLIDDNFFPCHNIHIYSTSIMIICSGLELIEGLEELPYTGVRGAGIIATNAVSMPHRSNI